jgi:hypothetical protein
VRHAEANVVALACVHQAPEKLLHVCRARRSLSRSALRGHVVILYDNSAAGEPGAKLLDYAHDTQQLTPVYRAALLGMRERQLKLLPTTIEPG